MMMIKQPSTIIKRAFDFTLKTVHGLTKPNFYGINEAIGEAV